MEPDTEELSIEVLEEKVKKNKVEMLKILKKAPVAGAYLGEDPKHWSNFFQFYIHFLKSQIGPRGQCSRFVRQSMSEDKEFYDKTLSLLKFDHETHIRDIYIKFKLYSPSKHYDKLVKLQETLQKSTESCEKIHDENSIMYKKIKEGMIQKRGEEYDYVSEINNIRVNYNEKIEKMKKEEEELYDILNQTENYLRYIKLKDAMKPFFQKWRQADAKIGQQSIVKGDSFEKIVEKNFLPIIFKRAKINPQEVKIKVLKNCRWVPRSLGQIDIAVARFHEEKGEWKIFILIQCKSRLFDIRQAYKQVSQDHIKQKNKEKLSTELGILELDDKIESFIVTTLPQHEFNFPIESKMKEGLEKGSKNKAIHEIEEKELQQIISQKFKQDLSPLEWFLQNDSDHILVWSYDQ